MAEQTNPLQTAVMSDPNCNITIIPGDNIPYYASGVSNNNIADAQLAIAQLTFMDIWRLPPFKIDYGTVHLGVMGVTAGGGRNWEIRINGLNGNATIAATTVQGNLATASTSDRQQYVQLMVRNALNESLHSKRTTDANGPCK
ncbi:hypothetical protein [Chitinophaga qingshengii]|uniref:Uncharacterized protein n=1 Tax=Chitinophaga qingshengii TaxID=1569794 RepID=A0ABR7TVH7_9BACT|nr:hypothetical protein [Chitinophaga qingshengii]MBC9934463.1 hypothetical protein [Chitinophaga qingshengii]